MTKDEIIKIAQKVTGVSFPLGVEGVSIGMNEKHLQDFANLVAAAEREKYYELLEEIKVWREAYPLSIFPVPDWEKVRDALTMNGLTLEAISAANLRHASNRFYEMLEEAIRARGQE